MKENNLPELPEPKIRKGSYLNCIDAVAGVSDDLYTAAQVREAQLSAIAADRVKRTPVVTDDLVKQIADKFGSRARRSGRYDDIDVIDFARALLANAPQVPDGFVLLPMVPNVEMCEVMNDDSWLWEDLLAAAGTITEDQYAELSAPQEHLSVPERMVQFIDHIINGVFEGGDWDGCALQNMAVRYGLLKPVEMQAPCSDEGCQCAQMEADFPVICYRKTYTAQSAPQPEQKAKAQYAHKPECDLLKPATLNGYAVVRNCDCGYLEQAEAQQSKGERE